MATNDNKPFIGRKEAIDQLFESVNSKNTSVTLVLGDEGVGKSMILEEFYRRLWEENQNQFIVGFYDQTKQLRSAKLIHPYISSLESLIKWHTNTKTFDDQFKETIKRLQKAFLKFGKEKAVEITSAIIQDIAEKAGLKETLKIAKDFLKMYKAEKSVTMLAEGFVNDNKGDIIESYIGILSSLAEAFNQQKFILIFDQFESVGMASIRFLIDLIMNLNMRMPSRFHVIISFRIKESNLDNESDNNLYDYISKEIRREKPQIITVEGLSEQEIDEWIKTIRDIDLPNHDLKRIRELSGGFPILLDEWISRSDTLNYEEIDRQTLCESILGHIKGLNDDDIKKLNQIAVLYQFVPPGDLAELFELGSTKDLDPLINRLIEHDIFERKNDRIWFRHGLLQKCIEDRIPEESKLVYHLEAASFYLELFEANKNSSNNSNDIALAFAYHLHYAGDHEKSYDENMRLATGASVIGDLDIAELCYKRAVEDARQLQNIYDMLHCYLELAHNVYVVWGRYKEASKYYNDILDASDEIDDSVESLRLRALVLFYISSTWIHRKKI